MNELSDGLRMNWRKGGCTSLGALAWETWGPGTHGMEPTSTGYLLVKFPVGLLKLGQVWVNGWGKIWGWEHIIFKANGLLFLLINP